MGTVNRNISRFEVTGVFTHPDARVDIVLVHGLNGQPERTWTAENNVFWPTDLLPVSLRDTPANILVYGYNADVFSRGNGNTASDNFVFQHAQTLVAHLTTYRRSERTSKNPIIWVAHSLGGIVLKRALLYSNDIRGADHEAFRSIYVSTHSIIFLGTPHTGSGLATWGRVLQGMSDAVVPRKLFESESILLKTLKKDNERLQEINSHFLDIYQRFHIHMVHENHKTNLKSTKALIVDADSASPQLPGVTYYGIEATHSGMCKFSGSNAPGYRTIATAIQEWVVEAPQIIEKRWAVEHKDREDSARHDAEERNMHYLAQRAENGTQDSPSQSTNVQPVDAVHATKLVPGPHVVDAGTSPMLLPPPLTPAQTPADAAPTKPEPPFLHPEPFRANSYFVGREKELADLHRRLTDPVRRAQGTSAVVIHSLTGGGKTHLARQYVFSHRDDYPGGIYWVRAKSIPEMEQFYWKIAKIAKSTALRDVVQRNLGRTSPETPSDTNTRRELSNPKNVVEIVRQWFSSFDQWLIVFDGILFNTPGIVKFIPDAKNTSLIYTSIQSGASGRWDFDSPQILHLGMLSSDEAQELLLTEMEKKKPWLHDDLERAREIVQLMDCFPLMIHTAAQHLKATHEPLHKYLRVYRKRTPAGDLSAFRAVWIDLKDRGATPALNLIYILAFFDSRIPVGLLHLGLGALDNRTPVLTRDAAHRSRSLNNSFRTLMAFALLERTEAGTIAQASSQSSSKRSDSLGPDPIDLLRINSVVQNFFIDVHGDSKQAGFWLERAAAVFCRSFNEAERLIKENPKLGLLDDYRCFKNNGEKLLEHLTHALDSKKVDPLFHALVDVKESVVSRLALCASAIDRLSEASQRYITTEMDLNNPTQEDTSMVSVFEHASSASDWEDSTTASSQASGDNSCLPSRTGTGLSAARGIPRPVSVSPGPNFANINAANAEVGADQNSGVSNGKDRAPLSQLVIDQAMGRLINTDSPLHMSPDHLFAPFVPSGDNPYHWHVPYPPERNYIPAPPMPGDSSIDGSDGGGEGPGTVVPTPRVPAADTGWNPPAFKFRHSTLPPGGTIPPPSGLPPTEHRTVRKSHIRRYHDTAGAWRDTAVRDPRTGKAPTRKAPTSVSREVARGSVYLSRQPSSASSSPGRGKISAGSEAEMALNKIRAVELARVASQKALELSSAELAQRSAHAGLASSSVVDTDDFADDEGTANKTNRGKGRSRSTGTMGVRPPLQSLRREDAARRSRLNEVFAEASDAPRPGAPPLVSQVASSDPQSPPFGRSILKRLQDNILSPWLSTGKPEQQQQQQQPQQQQQRQSGRRAENFPASAMPGTWKPYADDDAVFSRSINSLLEAQTGQFGQVSRTARSSPANAYGPFTPPQPLHHSFHHDASGPMYTRADYSNNGLARLRNAQTHVQAGTKVYRWTEEVYRTISDERLSDNDLDFGLSHGRFVMDAPFPPQPVRMSYPYGRPPTATEQLAGRPAEPLLQLAALATGYTSQPMSRNTSAESHAVRMAATGGGNLPDYGVWRATAARERATVGSTLYDDEDDDNTEVSALSQSMPAPSGFHSRNLHSNCRRRDSTRGGGGGISGSQVATPCPVAVPHLRRMSRSSLVETEPSPRTDNAFADVHTSYQLWEERHMHGDGGGGGGDGGGSGSGADSDAAGFGGYTHRARVRSSLHRGSMEGSSASTMLPARPLAEQAGVAVAAATGGADGVEGSDARTSTRGRSGTVGTGAAAEHASVTVDRAKVPRSYSDSGLVAAKSAVVLDAETAAVGGKYEYECENERPCTSVRQDTDGAGDDTG